MAIFSCSSGGLVNLWGNGYKWVEKVLLVKQDFRNNSFCIMIDVLETYLYISYHCVILLKV